MLGQRANISTEAKRPKLNDRDLQNDQSPPVCQIQQLRCLEQLDQVRGAAKKSEANRIKRHDEPENEFNELPALQTSLKRKLNSVNSSDSKKRLKVLQTNNTSISIQLPTKDNKNIHFEADLCSTVQQLKSRIKCEFQMPTELCYLTNNGKQLRNDRTLFDYGIQSESTLQLMLRVLGGAKKKSNKSKPAMTKAEQANNFERNLEAGLSKFAGINFSDFGAMDSATLKAVRTSFANAMECFEKGQRHDRAKLLAGQTRQILDDLEKLNSGQGLFQKESVRDQVIERIRNWVVLILEECAKENLCKSDRVESVRSSNQPNSTRTTPPISQQLPSVPPQVTTVKETSDSTDECVVLSSSEDEVKPASSTATGLPTTDSKKRQPLTPRKSANELPNVSSDHRSSPTIATSGQGKENRPKQQQERLSLPQLTSNPPAVGAELPSVDFAQFLHFQLGKFMHHISTIGDNNCVPRSIASCVHGNLDEHSVRDLSAAKEAFQSASDKHQNVRSKISEHIKKSKTFKEEQGTSACRMNNLVSMLDECFERDPEFYNNLFNLEATKEETKPKQADVHLKFRELIELKFNIMQADNKIKQASDSKMPDLEKKRNELGNKSANLEKELKDDLMERLKDDPELGPRYKLYANLTGANGVELGDEPKDDLKKTLEDELEFEARYKLYADLTRANGVWLGDEHFQAAADLYNVRFFVFYLDSKDVELVEKEDENGQLVQVKKRISFEERMIHIHSIFDPANPGQGTTIRDGCVIMDGRHCDVLLPKDPHQLNVIANGLRRQRDPKFVQEGIKNHYNNYCLAVLF